MSTADIYGFKHDNIGSARSAIESALSIRFHEGQEDDFPGSYFIIELPSGLSKLWIVSMGLWPKSGGPRRPPAA